MAFLRVALTVLLAPPLFVVAALCAVAAVAAQFGRRSLEWDILAHFAPLGLAGALLALAAALAFRGHARALILSMGAVGALAAGVLVAPEFLRDTGPTAAPDAPDQLKLIQLNVWVRNADPEATVDWLIREEPDIVVLEETSPAFRGLVRERTGWHVTCPNCETMILSRRAPVSRGVPAGVPKAPGPLVRAVFRDRHGEFSVIGVHYAWPTDIADQQAQERRLAAAIAAGPRGRTIVAGDLNSAPWSFSRHRWDAEFGLPRRDRAVFSWPAPQSRRLRWLGLFPFLPIDHVYAGEDWATVSVERGPRLGSDHYPLVVTLAPVARP